MRTIAATCALVLFSSACAEAKPKATIVVKKPAQKPTLPEFVEPDDAAKALVAFSEQKAAQIRWDAARRMLLHKYGIDLAKNEGWDEPDSEGRLRARRMPRDVK